MHFNILFWLFVARSWPHRTTFGVLKQIKEGESEKTQEKPGLYLCVVVELSQYEHLGLGDHEHPSKTERCFNLHL